MALTATGAALTEAQRVAQAKNAVLVAYVVGQLWDRYINPDDIDGSSLDLIARLLPMLKQRWELSSQIARSYYTNFRAAEIKNGGSFAMPDPGQLDTLALSESLRIMGAVGLKKRIGQLPPAGIDGAGVTKEAYAGLVRQAIADTATDIGGAASRHVLNGGRDELQSAMAEDRQALGYIRVTDGDPCYFCAMLASRGPVYDGESFDSSDPRFIGEGSHKVHDHDQCTVEPVYSRKTKWPGKAQAAEKAWMNLSEELGRVPTINDFRKRWEGRA